MFMLHMLPLLVSLNQTDFDKPKQSQLTIIGDGHVAAVHRIQHVQALQLP